VLRAIGDPEARLREDRLRALRAARFAARFALRVDPATESAVRRFAGDLAAVSRERVGNEIRRMLVHPTRARAVELVESLGLGPSVLLEPEAATDRSLLAALAPGAGFEESLAAWMLGRPGAEGASDVSAARQRRWRDALVLSNGESDLLAAILANVPRIPASWTQADRAGRKRLAASDGFRGALALLRAAGHPIAAAVSADLPELEREGLRPAPFVTGDDLVALGLRPGPAFRPLLDRAYDLQLNGAVADREAALAAVRTLISGV
jgi:poly(A) polymerase